MQKIRLILLILFAFFVSEGAVLALEESEDISSEQILSMIGLRLNKVFQKFGYPTDLLGTCEDGEFEVTLDYGSYGFKIKNKMVIICFFWSTYKQSVRGIKIGDSSTKAVSILGKPMNQFEREDKSTVMFWDDKENDAYFVVFVSEEGKITKMQLELK